MMGLWPAAAGPVVTRVGSIMMMIFLPLHFLFFHTTITFPQTPGTTLSFSPSQ